MQLGTIGVEDKNGNVEFGSLLLKAEVTITRKKDIKFQFRLFQQRAIRQSAPTHLLR